MILTNIKKIDKKLFCFRSFESYQLIFETTIHIHLRCVEALRIRFPTKGTNFLLHIFQNLESYVKAEG